MSSNRLFQCAQALVEKYEPGHALILGGSVAIFYCSWLLGFCPQSHENCHARTFVRLTTSNSSGILGRPHLICSAPRHSHTHLERGNTRLLALTSRVHASPSQCSLV